MTKGLRVKGGEPPWFVTWMPTVNTFHAYHMQFSVGKL